MRVGSGAKRACELSVRRSETLMRRGRLVAGLLERMRGRKRRQRKAAIGQRRHQRIGAQLELEKMRADHLAGDADIGEPGLRAERERRRRPARQQPLIGRKAFMASSACPSPRRAWRRRQRPWRDDCEREAPSADARRRPSSAPASAHRPALSTSCGISRGSGWMSSRYSMIASDWKIEWPSWMKVGTTRSALTAS